MEKDKHIQYLYQQWQQIQLAILGIYLKNPKLKYENISEDENFYRLKNVILDETFANMDNGIYAEDGYMYNIYPDDDEDYLEEIAIENVQKRHGRL